MEAQIGDQWNLGWVIFVKKLSTSGSMKKITFSLDALVENGSIIVIFLCPLSWICFRGKAVFVWTQDSWKVICVTGPVQSLIYKFYGQKYRKIERPNCYYGLPFDTVKTVFEQDDVHISWEVTIKKKESTQTQKETVFWSFGSPGINGSNSILSLNYYWPI